MLLNRMPPLTTRQLRSAHLELLAFATANTSPGDHVIVSAELYDHMLEIYCPQHFGPAGRAPHPRPVVLLINEQCVWRTSDSDAPPWHPAAHQTIAGTLASAGVPADDVRAGLALRLSRYD
jgi:hypothetical protein